MRFPLYIGRVTGEDGFSSDVPKRNTTPDFFAVRYKGGNSAFASAADVANFQKMLLARNLNDLAHTHGELTTTSQLREFRGPIHPRGLAGQIQRHLPRSAFKKWMEFKRRRAEREKVEAKVRDFYSTLDDAARKIRRNPTGKNRSDLLLALKTLESAAPKRTKVFARALRPRLLIAEKPRRELSAKIMRSLRRGGYKSALTKLTSTSIST